NRPSRGGNRGRSNGRGLGYYNNNSYYPPELPVFYDYVPRQYQIPFQQQQQNNYAQPILGYPTATKRNTMSNSFQDRQISNNTVTNNNSNVQNQQYNTNKQKTFRQNKVSRRGYNVPNLVYRNNTQRTTDVVPSRPFQDGYSSDQQFQGQKHMPRPPTTLNRYESDINLVRNKNQLQTTDDQYEDMFSNTIEGQTPMYFEQINQSLAKTPKYLKPAVLEKIFADSSASTKVHLSRLIVHFDRLARANFQRVLFEQYMNFANDNEWSITAREVLNNTKSHDPAVHIKYIKKQLVYYHKLIRKEADHIDANHDACRDDKGGIWDTEQIQSWSEIKSALRIKKFIEIKTMAARGPLNLPLPILNRFDTEIPIMSTLDKTVIKKLEDDFKQICTEAKEKMHNKIYRK
ncbi:unnamed protein product, partial [Didymodactylos carnosus]